MHAAHVAARFMFSIFIEWLREFSQVYFHLLVLNFLIFNDEVISLLSSSSIALCCSLLESYRVPFGTSRCYATNECGNIFLGEFMSDIKKSITAVHCNCQTNTSVIYPCLMNTSVMLLCWR